MIIKTERLELEPLGIKHLENYNSFASDPNQCQMMCYLPMDGIEMSKTFLCACDAEWAKESPRAWEFAILLKGECIGEISIYNEDGQGELGWILSKYYQGKGYAFEAAKAILDFGVNELGFLTFIAHCDTENLPSYRLMEKLGMQRIDESHNRKNKLSPELRGEYTYEINLKKQISC